MENTNDNYALEALATYRDTMKQLIAIDRAKRRQEADGLEIEGEEDTHTLDLDVINSDEYAVDAILNSFVHSENENDTIFTYVSGLNNEAS